MKNYLVRTEIMHMTVKERILALRLLEKQKKNPELAKKLGINVHMKKKVKHECTNTNLD